MALGTIEAIIVFQLVQAVRDAFTSMIKDANDFANALYQIGEAQDVIARNGINIQQQDLLDIVKQLNKEFGVFSYVEMTDAVAKSALLTSNYKLTKDQIEEVTRLAATLAIQEGNIANMPQYIEQITRSLATGTGSQALEKIGANLTNIQVQAEAVRLGLVHGNEALTEQDKIVASLSLLAGHYSEQMQDAAKYQETLPGQTSVLQKAWADLLTLLGNAFAPMLLKIIGFTVTSIEDFKNVFLILYIGFNSLVVIAGVFWDALTLTGKVKSWDDAVDKINKGIDSVVANARKLYNMQGLTGNPMSSNTPVGTPAIATPDMSKFTDDIQKSYDDIIKLTDDFNTKQEQQWEDYKTNKERTEQDYNNNVAQTIQDANEKRASIEEKYRTQQIDAEAKFQEELKKLREEYLFNLEDALRARDAKQVLNLMEKYDLDKQNLTDQYNLEKKQRDEQLKQELADNKKAEDDKLALMKQEEQLKLQRMQEDYNTEKTRETQQYNDQKAALVQQLHDKLVAEAQALADELGVKGDGVKLIYDLLNKYYGSGGEFDKLYDGSNASLLSKATQMLAELQAIAKAYQSAINSMAGGAVNWGDSGGGGNGSSTAVNWGDNGGGGNGSRATGGIDIANTPTNVTFGDAGMPEAHIFIPLGNNVSMPNVSGVGSNSGSGGKSTIEISLAPDLIGNIVAKSLDATANVILKVSRSK
jgi:hypothetical protein